jgi:hypothetical protein
MIWCNDNNKKQFWGAIAMDVMKNQFDQYEVRFEERLN